MYTDEAADDGSMESIEVVEPPRRALSPAVNDFWTTRSLAELAEEQGVGVVIDIEILQDGSISDEDAEAFIEALGL